MSLTGSSTQITSNYMTVGQPLSCIPKGANQNLMSQRKMYRCIFIMHLSTMWSNSVLPCSSEFLLVHKYGTLHKLFYTLLRLKGRMTVFVFQPSIWGSKCSSLSTSSVDSLESSVAMTALTVYGRLCQQMLPLKSSTRRQQ